jgi:outer membrane lipoprotein-sorting protein
MILERRQFLLAVAFGAVSVSLELPARADSVDEALEKVAKARANIKTLQAPFRQTRKIGLLATEVKSTGMLTLVRPDRLRWELKPPDAVVYWIGPEGLAMQNSDGVTKVGKRAAGKFGAVLGDMLVMLGGDLKKLRKRYDLSVEHSEERFVLTAMPKAKDVKKHIKKLKMEAKKELWAVTGIEIHEKNGDKSLIAFDKFVRDKAIKPEYMKPPEK